MRETEVVEVEIVKIVYLARGTDLFEPSFFSGKTPKPQKPCNMLFQPTNSPPAGWIQVLGYIHI